MEKLNASEKIRHLLVRDSNGKFHCTVGENCDYYPKTLVVSNCCRHIRDQHPVEFNILNLGKRIPPEEVEAILQRKRFKSSGAQEDSTVVRVYRQKLMGGLIKLCTLHNCPFSSVEWEGLRDIVDPMLDAFKIKVNRHNIVDTIGETSGAIIELIKSEVKNQLLSVKFDCTTKMNKSVLGVSVQFYKDLTLVSRSVGKKNLI